MSSSLWPHGLQHPRFLCPPLSPGVCSNSWPLSWWCYLTISAIATAFSYWLQSFPTSGSFPMNWLFASGGQSIRPSASVPPMNIQAWFPLGLTSLVSLLSKRFLRVFSSTTVWKHQFFIISLLYSPTLISILLKNLISIEFFPNTGQVLKYKYSIPML